MEVRVWIDGGPEPETVKEASFLSDRLDTMRTRLSAAYKGVHALLMSKGARDFRSGQTIDDTVFFDERVDIHHIFSQDWCKGKIEPKTYNSVVNKTPLTRKTNQIIGGAAPSKYLSKLVDQGSIDDATLEECLESHLIEPSLLRSDDFDKFYSTRKKELSELIYEAMGKSIDEGTSFDEVEGDELLDPEDMMETTV